MMGRVNVNVHPQEVESFAAEAWATVQRGFPLYGLSVWWAMLIALVAFTLLIVWNLTGKGKGSHAGREEVRRQYRRALAREMAKQDAEAIRAGTKKRRWYYKW